MNRHIARGTEARVVAACGLFALAVSFHAGQARAETVSETITVDSAKPNPTTAHTRLLAGGVYTFTVSGTFAYGLGGQADAECTTLPPDSTWTRARFAAIDPNQDDLDLYVNDHNVDWQPVTADPQRRRASTGDAGAARRGVRATRRLLLGRVVAPDRAPGSGRRHRRDRRALGGRGHGPDPHRGRRHRPTRCARVVVAPAVRPAPLTTAQATAPQPRSSDDVFKSCQNGSLLPMPVGAPTLTLSRPTLLLPTHTCGPGSVTSGIEVAGLVYVPL